MKEAETMLAGGHRRHIRGTRYRITHRSYTATLCKGESVITRNIILRSVAIMIPMHENARISGRITLYFNVLISIR